MCRYFTFIAVSLFLSTSSYGKNINEYLVDVERNLLEKNYTQADKNFQGLKKRVKNHAIKGYTVSSIYEKTVKWLKKVDEIDTFIVKVSSNSAIYEANGDYGISLKGCQGRNCQYYYKQMIDSGLPKTLPFSQDFVDYVNSRKSETYESFLQANRSLHVVAEEEKKRHRDAIKAARERERLEAKQKMEEEGRIRERTENERKARIEREVKRIDSLAKAAGYAGYSNMSLVAMIYKTQKEGGLEKHLKKVVGCHDLNKRPCEKWYPKLRVIQALEDGILYSFSEYSGEEYVDFTIFADRESGKIYQEGQSFKNEYYVFIGMVSYTTVTGINKSIPYFSKAKLP